jgi:hypothetical protein
MALLIQLKQQFSAELAAEVYKQQPKKKLAATTSDQPSSGTEQNQCSGKNAVEKICSTMNPHQFHLITTQIVLNNSLIATQHLLVWQQFLPM